MMTPVGILLSLVLTVLGMIGIWGKDRTEYFGLGGKQEKVAPREYFSLIRRNKPLRRLMVAGGSCKLAMALAANVTILCILYGSMTQFGLGFTGGEALSGVAEVSVGGAEYMVGLEVDRDTQFLGIHFAEDRDIEEVTVYTADALFQKVPDGTVTVIQPVDAVAAYVDENGKLAPLELDETGEIEGLQRDADGGVTGLCTRKANRVVGLLVDENGILLDQWGQAARVQVSDDGQITGLRAEDTIKLAGRNGYDNLYLVIMALGYVFAAPFFLFTVRTARRHGQKKALTKYVTIALICFSVVAALMILWRFGDPAWNMSVYEGTIAGGDIKITINLFTVLFLVFYGLGYGAYYATADLPIPMVADCADYETFRTGKFIPGIMGTMLSFVDKLVSSLSATVVSVGLLCIGILDLPTKATPYVEGMNYLVVALFCVVPMLAWVLTLWAMSGYELDGDRVKAIQRVNSARKQAIAAGMSREEAMAAITEETVSVN